MRWHLLSRTAKFNSKCVSRSAPFLAVLLLAVQAVAQNPIIRSSTDQAQVATGSQQITAAPSTPLPTEISVPEPAQQEANLSSPPRIPFLALAAWQDSNQSSSQNAPATITPPKTMATKTKPPHHALGITLAVVGTTALVAGVALYAGEQHAYCNGTSSGCNEAKDSGLALMPIGAGVAAIGFYLQFHH
jgi:hypothetical protein